MGRKYKNPPLIEAVCEFQFEAGADWDNTIFGLVYEQIKDIFPKRKSAKHLAVNLAAIDSTVQQQLRTFERVQLLQEDEKILVQVGENLLAVNHLVPYSSWDVFLPLVEKAFIAYQDVAKPKALARVSLRYINKVILPISDGVFEVQEHLNIFPHLGEDFEKMIGPFRVLVQFPYDVVEYTAINVMNVSITNEETFNIEAPRQSSILMLDFEYFRFVSEFLTIDQIKDWLNIAHKRIEDAFEASITDKSREIFEVIN